MDEAARRETGAAIARVQRADGSIPWYPGGPVDPWDHVEAAMGLDVAGRHDDAMRAYAWLRTTQRSDGSWPSARVRGRVTDGTGDANFAAYVATGLWLHLLATGDDRGVAHLWPTVDRAVEYALGLQAPGGEVWWARDPARRADRTALVTASSAVLLSLRCGSALGDRVGAARPDWELAAGRLAAALRDRGSSFTPVGGCAALGRCAPFGRHSMDWYWPVLAGALPAPRGRERLEASWSLFVVDGLGARCVSDRPWVTAAETAELAMALVCCGEDGRATQLLADVQHLRDPGGAYWTGYVYPDRARWPVERTTWTAGAVLLASDALVAGSPTRTMLGTRLDVVVDTSEYAQGSG